MNIDKKTGGFNSLGEFLVKVRKAYDGEGTPDSRLILGKTAGHMVEGDDSQGGALVPTQYADVLYHAALENAIVRPRVAKGAIFKATSDSVIVRRFVDADRSSNIFGGVTFEWIEEKGQKADVISKPAIGSTELNIHKLVGGCFASNELENDYGKYGDFMALAFGQAIRFIEDDAYINGTGGGMPLGITQAGCRTQVTRAAVGAIDWADISNMVARLLPRSWESAVWLLNPDAIVQLFNATAPAANQATALDLSKRTLWGIPFIPTEKCQAMGTEGDIILADFDHGHYLIADREMRISSSRHVNVSDMGFKTDETFWKIVLRTDGQPLLSADIAPKRGANDLGMFIMLTTTS